MPQEIKIPPVTKFSKFGFNVCPAIILKLQMVVKLVAENTFLHINQKRNLLNMKGFQVFDILNSRTFPTRSLKQKIPICKIGL